MVKQHTPGAVYVNIGDDEHPVYACTNCNGEIVRDDDFSTFVHNKGCKYWRPAPMTTTAQRWEDRLQDLEDSAIVTDIYRGPLAPSVTAADVRHWAALESRVAALEAALPKPLAEQASVAQYARECRQFTEQARAALAQEEGNL